MRKGMSALGGGPPKNKLRAPLQFHFRWLPVKFNWISFMVHVRPSAPSSAAEWLTDWRLPERTECFSDLITRNGKLKFHALPMRGRRRRRICQTARRRWTKRRKKDSCLSIWWQLFGPWRGEEEEEFTEGKWIDDNESNQMGGRSIFCFCHSFLLYSKCKLKS